LESSGEKKGRRILEEGAKENMKGRGYSEFLMALEVQEDSKKVSILKLTPHHCNEEKSL